MTTTHESTTRRPALELLAIAALVMIGWMQGPAVPKVPFGNKPCESLSAADEKSLGLTDVEAKPDRAPATLPIDNFCSYRRGGSLDAQVGYLTELDYETNQKGNRSTSRTAPADLPGAFYDAQAGLWFAKNGYFVVVSGRHKYVEPAAHIIVAKLQ